MVSPRNRSKKSRPLFRNLHELPKKAPPFRSAPCKNADAAVSPEHKFEFGEDARKRSQTQAAPTRQAPSKSGSNLLGNIVSAVPVRAARTSDKPTEVGVGTTLSDLTTSGKDIQHVEIDYSQSVAVAEGEITLSTQNCVSPEGSDLDRPQLVDVGASSNGTVVSTLAVQTPNSDEATLRSLAKWKALPKRAAPRSPLGRPQAQMADSVTTSKQTEAEAKVVNLPRTESLLRLDKPLRAPPPIPRSKVQILEPTFLVESSCEISTAGATSALTLLQDSRKLVLPAPGRAPPPPPKIADFLSRSRSRSVEKGDKSVSRVQRRRSSLPGVHAPKIFLVMHGS